MAEPLQGELILPGESNPWTQLPSEPHDWYHRFAYHYLPLGSDRSVFAAYKSYRYQQDNKALTYDGCDPGWYQAAERYDWESRAQAYDNHHLQQWMDNLETTKEEVKRQRIEAYRLTLAKTTEAIALKDTESMSEEESIASLSNAQKNSGSQLKAELDGTTPHTQVNVLVADLSPELRTALVEAIKRRT